MSLVATCHCGDTRLIIAQAPESVTACTCTFCSKRGILWAYFDNLADVRIEGPRAHDADYAPSGLNHHHFCAKCGCGTYSITLTWSQETFTPDTENPRIGINARLLDDFDLEAIPHKLIDGRNLW